MSTNQHYFCHQKSWYLNTLCREHLKNHSLVFSEICYLHTKIHRTSPQQAGAHRGTFCRILSLSFDRVAQRWHCHQSVDGWPGQSSEGCLLPDNQHTWVNTRGNSSTSIAECSVHRWLFKCIHFTSQGLIFTSNSYMYMYVNYTHAHIATGGHVVLGLFLTWFDDMQ